MGWRCPPMYGKKVNYYEKKIEKIDKKIKSLVHKTNKKIKSLEEDKKVYEEIISKQTKDTPLVEKDETKN